MESKTHRSAGTILSLWVGIISVIISVYAIVLSKRQLILSSKDYTPEIDFYFPKGDSDVITVINKSNDIFDIRGVHVIEIAPLGYADDGMEIYIPLIEKSNSIYIPEHFKTTNSRTYEIDFNKIVSACSYVCPIDKLTYRKLRNRIYSHYDYISILEEHYQLIEIHYSDRFKNHKSLVFEYYHNHGVGDFTVNQISKKDLDEIMKQVEIPKFDNFEKLWKYLTSRYRYKFASETFSWK